MAMNVNELIFEKARELIFTDLSDGSVIGRLTNLKDPSLSTAAEGEEVTDAEGSLITTLYGAKTGKFEATNALFSMDLAAQQFGTKKEIASDTDTIVVPASETLTIEDGKITLSHLPTEDLKHIYKLENRQLAETYSLDASASDKKFSINGKVITVPTGAKGSIYVEYEYESKSAVKVSNRTNSIPEAVGVKIFAIFRDVCNENTKYAGTIVAKKGRIDPSQVDVSLSGTEGHAFAVDFMKDYCEEDGDLFSIIIAE